MSSYTEDRHAVQFLRGAIQKRCVAVPFQLSETGYCGYIYTLYNTIMQYSIDNSPWGLFSDNIINESFVAFAFAEISAGQARFCTFAS